MLVVHPYLNGVENNSVAISLILRLTGLSFLLSL